MQLFLRDANGVFFRPNKWSLGIVIGKTVSLIHRAIYCGDSKMPNGGPHILTIKEEEDSGFQDMFSCVIKIVFPMLRVLSMCEVAIAVQCLFEREFFGCFCVFFCSYMCIEHSLVTCALSSSKILFS